MYHDPQKHAKIRVHALPSCSITSRPYGTLPMEFEHIFQVQSEHGARVSRSGGDFSVLVPLHQLHGLLVSPVQFVDIITRQLGQGYDPVLPLLEDPHAEAAAHQSHFARAFCFHLRT